MRNTYQTQLQSLRSGQPRNLLFCFDGTWNDPSDAYEKGSDITNVLKIHRAARQNATQKSLYYTGVGTGGKMDQILGGLTGKGAKKIRNQAYIDLVTDYRPGDRIFITGFSRGASIARMFAQLVYEHGIPETLEFNKSRQRFKVKGNRHPIVIDVLGVFDTVASFGIPSDIAGIPFQQIDLFHDLTVAPNVKKVYHLVATHEGRNTFKPTLCNAQDRVEEIWFPGVHADVGGGYADSGISDIALDFMVKRFQEHGVQFTDEALAKIRPNLTGQIHDKTREDWALKLIHREISVWKGNKPSGDPPKIHHTVFDRIKRFGERLPPHLQRLQNRYQVIDSGTQTSRKLGARS